MICNMYIMSTILHQSDTCSLSICKFFPFFMLSLTLLLVYRTNKIRECHLKCIFPAYKIERKNKNSYERNGQKYFAVDYDRNIIPHNMCQFCTLSAIK